MTFRKKNKYPFKDPAAIEWLKAHADEFSPSSFSDNTTMNPQVLTEQHVERGEELRQFAPLALGGLELYRFNAMLDAEYGEYKQLAVDWNFPSTDHLHDYLRRLKRKVTKAIQERRAVYKNRTALLPEQLVQKLTVETRTFRLGEREETLHRVLHNGRTTWVDAKGFTFNAEVLEVLENIDDVVCDVLEIEE